jgi:hypothetical protein
MPKGKHQKTSGAREFDKRPLKGTPIQPKEGIKPFSGYFWSLNGHGPFVQNLAYPGTQPDWNFCVTICEIDIGSGRPYIGGAAMYIGNVAPESGNVLVYGHVDWDSDIQYRITVSAV